MLDTLTSLPWWAYLLIILGIIALWDILQRRHTILHNYPLVGHLRYLIEMIGPEMRQYVVADNREELPFNCRLRSWIFASAKKENNFKGFGTDQNIHEPGYIFIKPALLARQLPVSHPHSVGNSEHPRHHTLPSAKVIGLYHGRQRPYRPRSVINISAMSYGSLSAKAVESLNRGSLKFGNYHNTGEGGLSPHHKNGADVVFQIGTAYFGVRDDDGNFSLEKLVKMVEENPFIRMIEVKLSQGAKPGKGGVLPAKKITKEIAEIRNIEKGQDVVSPPYHREFSDVPGLVDFVEKIAEATGLPVGIKAAVGKLEMWQELADIMLKKEIIEISHAATYEHPCQFTMEDVEIAMGDNNSTSCLANNYGYTKDPVSFEGMDHLLRCPHLGGNNKTPTPEAATA